MKIDSNKARMLIKISGEYLKSSDDSILDINKLNSLALQIKELQKDYEVGLVVGGGNIWRGAGSIGMDRAQADYMGMLATIMNALAIQNSCENNGIEAVVYSALEAPKVAEPYIRRNAINNLKKGRVAIFAGGTGHPFFTTDTAAALRAADIGANYILMAKNGVDGVFSSDPKKDKNAKFYEHITYDEVLSKKLSVMDQTALTICRDNNIKLIVFNILIENSISLALNNKIKRTLID
jgi:uridylate kinase